MAFAERFIFSWIRFCLHCGTYDPPTRTFCDECWHKFIKLIQVRVHEVAPNFKVITLIDWKEENYDLILSFVMAQKGGGLKPLISELISWNALDINLLIWAHTKKYNKSSYICSKTPTQRPTEKRIDQHLKNPCSGDSGDELLEAFTLVPIPPTERGRDHAHSIAKIMSSLCGLPIRPKLLAIGTKSSQKFKRKNERTQVEFSLNPVENMNGGVLIIDDIITTGSTLLAAQRASKAPHSLGFALVNRFSRI